MIFLDTHILIWLGMQDEKRLSLKARRLIDLNPVVISPFVRMELGFMYEIGRLKKPLGDFLPQVLSSLNATYHEQSIFSVVAQAESLGWTRDPFDRLIVGHCLAAEGKLITKDELILQNCKSAVW